MGSGGSFSGGKEVRRMIPNALEVRDGRLPQLLVTGL